MIAGGGFLFFVLGKEDIVYKIETSNLPAKQVWQFDSHEPISRVFFSPVDIYFTGESGVYAVNRITGLESWYIERDNLSLLIPPSLTHDILLVVTNQKRFIEAIDSDTGHTKWRVSVKKVAASDLAQVVAIAVKDETVFVGATLNRGTSIFALDLGNGSERWDAPQRLPEASPSDLAIYGNWLVVQGESLWYLDPNKGTNTTSKPLPVTNRFVFGLEQIFATVDESGIQAIDPLTAVKQWTFRAPCAYADYWLRLPPQPPANVLSIIVSCPKGLFYDGGSLYSVDADNGLITWRHSPELGHIPISVTNMDGHSYYLTLDGSVYALDIRNGQEVGELHVTPGELRDLGENASVSSDNEMLVLLLGNSQAFAFQNQ